ncbi:MAG: hypothetical protein ACKVKG_17075, partial [Alphaproteobacteria bacterium]
YKTLPRFHETFFLEFPAEVGSETRLSKRETVRAVMSAVRPVAMRLAKILGKKFIASQPLTIQEIGRQIGSIVWNEQLFFDLLGQLRPRLILLSGRPDAFYMSLVHAAKRQGVPTVVIQDHFMLDEGGGTAADLIPSDNYDFLPDYMIVWDDQMKDWMEAAIGIERTFPRFITSGVNSEIQRSAADGSSDHDFFSSYIERLQEVTPLCLIFVDDVGSTLPRIISMIDALHDKTFFFLMSKNEDAISIRIAQESLMNRGVSNVDIVSSESIQPLRILSRVRGLVTDDPTMALLARKDGAPVIFVPNSRVPSVTEAMQRRNIPIANTTEEIVAALHPFLADPNGSDDRNADGGDTVDASLEKAVDELFDHWKHSAQTVLRRRERMAQRSMNDFVC